MGHGFEISFICRSRKPQWNVLVDLEGVTQAIWLMSVHTKILFRGFHDVFGGTMDDFD